MNQGEGVPVAGDLLLRAVPWGCGLTDQGFHPRTRGCHALYPIGAIRGLDERNQSEGFEDFRGLLEKEFLFSKIFPDPSQRGKLFRFECK
jgi:hypothetical protein